MNEDAKKLLTKACALSPGERAELACSLIESLDGVDEKSIQASWDAEIIQRMEDLDSGKVKQVSLEEARRRLSSALD